LLKDTMATTVMTSHHDSRRGASQAQIDGCGGEVEPADLGAHFLDEIEDVARVQIVDERRRHAREHRRTAREQKEGHDDEGYGAHHRVARGIEEVLRAARGRRNRRGMSPRGVRDTQRVGAALELIEVLHETCNGRDALPDRLQRLRRRREPVLSGLPQHLGGRADERERDEENQQGAHPARHAQPMQGLDRARQDQGQEQCERDGDEGDVGFVQQQTERAPHEHLPRARRSSRRGFRTGLGRIAERRIRVN
jgi:hypothetical protein